jgi:predicted metal-dependent phosphoesterase TrpH
MWNVDCHVHTTYSVDGKVPLDEVIGLCRKKGLDCIAVTDHNTREGALKLKDLAKNALQVVVGEEIKTIDGEVIGLFLQDPIAPGLTIEETVQNIRQQQGLVCIPHPFCRFRKSRISSEALGRIIDQVDIIEIFNSRTLIDKDNIYARRFALEHKKGMVVGSDAHLPCEYGMSYLAIKPFSRADEFMNNLVTSEVVMQKSPFWVHLVTKAENIGKARDKKCNRRDKFTFYS